MPARSDGKPSIDIKELRSIARWQAMRFVTGSSEHAIEDVTQSAIAEYLSTAAKEEVDVPGALIRIITRRLGIKFRDDWEKKRPDLSVDHHGVSGEDSNGTSFEPASERVSPTAELALDARRRRIAEAVGELDPVDQEIVRLTYLAEPPQKAPDVAKHLGLRPGTVRNRLVAIRRILALRLNEESQ